ncbi:MAG: tRNA (adenosine(37)-N6)-dimethylallyltransferase MiaA [Bradymonadia bacterium]
MTAPLLCIVGPTAVGKTALSIALAQATHAEVVSADASQIYQGLDIGTGKVTADEMGDVPHHLIDVVRPDEAFDAQRYIALADAAIAEIRGRGRPVIVCGGTGLYIRALIHGLCPAPPVDDAIRAEIQAQIAQGELPVLHAALAEADPEAARRIAPADRQRIERALGVFRTTGRTLSAWQAEHRFAEHRHQAVFLGLNMERPQLNDRIDRRAQAMFEGGLVDEVARLEAAGYGAALRSMSAIGYRYAAEVHHGTLTKARAIELTARDTRRYAKRQVTWFKALEGVMWHTPPVQIVPLLKSLGAAGWPAGTVSDGIDEISAEETSV